MWYASVARVIGSISARLILLNLTPGWVFHVQLQAYRLEPGYNWKQVRKCHLCMGQARLGWNEQKCVRPIISYHMVIDCLPCQDWDDPSLDARWRSTVGEEAWDSAFKQGEKPFQMVPGLESSKRLLPDTLHTFHLGWGKDLGSSAVVLLARLKLLEGRSLDAKLETGYMSFCEWCHAHGKTCSTTEFSKLKFDMETTLD